MKRLTLALGLAMAAPLYACNNAPATTDGAPSSSSEAMTVHGVLPPSLRSLDNARAIAVGADGRTFAAYLDPKGGFTLNLPVNHAYRILFANSRADGSEVVLGHMIVNTSHGKEEF